MIKVFELICREQSHEVFNAGFLNLICRAFPDEDVVFFAHQSQINCVENELVRSGAGVLRVTGYKVSLPFFDGIIYFTRLFVFLSRHLFNTEKSKINFIIFLSYDRTILLVLKLLLRLHPNFNECILLNTHGILEEAFNSGYINPRDHKNPRKSLIQRTRKLFLELKKHPVYGLRKLINFIYSNISNLMMKPYQMLVPKFKDVFKMRFPETVGYIINSGHIIDKMQTIPELANTNAFLIPLPRIMREASPISLGEKIIFAVIGYGMPENLNSLIELLLIANPSPEFEIRLIGLQPTSFKKYPFVRIIEKSDKKMLTRAEMEEHIKDVNFQIILYPFESYHLSQSGSIYEAFAYCKPIIHLSNPCANYYNNTRNSIGRRCETLTEMASFIGELITNREFAEDFYKNAYQNLLYVRDLYGIDSSIPKLKSAIDSSKSSHNS
jgi:hypothetical protein